MKKISMLSSMVRWLIFLLTTVVVFTVYTASSGSWVDFGGINFELLDRYVFLFELPFVIILSSILFFSKIKNRIIRYFFPATPLIFFYSSFDIFYSFLKRSPHPSDLYNHYMIEDFSPWLKVAVFIWVFAIPATLILILFWKSSKVYSPTDIFVSSPCRLILLVLITVTVSTSTFSSYHEKIFNYIDWSQERTIRSNGRFASFIYYGGQERKNRNYLNKFSKRYLSKSINIHEKLYKFPDGAGNPVRNIHFIILESFLDPRLLKDVQFNTSPLAPELAPFLLPREKFSLVTSPVYGGQTAQAEFELLTGIRALAKIDSVEFNVMMGNAANSFAKRLADFNYRTVATIASSSIYFNSKQAYRSLGFKEITFMKELKEFSAEKSYLPIFDGDVFKHNLEKVQPIIKEKKTPLFNYVIGMYGHFPYETVKEEHKDVIEVKHDDERVGKIANQFFYRTKALADYVRKLIEIDPDSMIYITSDHLPPILWDGTQYQLDQHVNIALLIDSGKSIDVSEKKYFQIPWMIWSTLLKTDNSPQISEEDMENMYYKLLSESMCR